jgi:hypothetical protein
MATPVISFENATIAERIFAELPSGFSVDPLEVDAIDFVLFYPTNAVNDLDKITITIQDAVMTISSQVHYVESEYIDLRNYTIRKLIDYFNRKYPSGFAGGGISVYMSDNADASSLDLLSTVLLEGSLEIDGVGVSWPRFTADNYKLVFSLMLLLKEHQEASQSALRQTDLRVAGGEWLNYWGDILGIPRMSGEIGNDENYRGRLLRETLMPKSNNWAIADILENALNAKVRVVDGGAPFVLVNCTLGAGSDSKLLDPSLLGITNTPNIQGTYGQLHFHQQSARWYTCIAEQVENVSAVWRVLPDPRHHLSSSSFLAFTGLLPVYPSFSNYSVVETDTIIKTETQRIFTNPAAPHFYGYIDKNEFSDDGYQVLTITSLREPSRFTVDAGIMISLSTESSYWKLEEGTLIVSELDSFASSFPKKYRISKTQTRSIGSSGSPVSFDAGYSLWAQIDSASTFETSLERNMDKLGPITGIGSFTVYVESDLPNGLLSPQLRSLVYQLVNKYKAAGVSFLVKPLQ